MRKDFPLLYVYKYKTFTISNRRAHYLGRACNITVG